MWANLGEVSMNRVVVAVVAMVVVALSAGCTVTGPSRFEAGHVLYNQAVNLTTNEQLLLNLVRLRYRDTPTFLQAGQDYALARDDYVYIYSPNEDRRRNNDSLILARVPKDKITDRAAYRFFGGLDDAGQATWTANIAQRKPVHISGEFSRIQPAPTSLFTKTVSGSSRF